MTRREVGVHQSEVGGFGGFVGVGAAIALPNKHCSSAAGIIVWHAVVHGVFPWYLQDRQMSLVEPWVCVDGAVPLLGHTCSGLLCSPVG